MLNINHKTITSVFFMLGYLSRISLATADNLTDITSPTVDKNDTTTSYPPATDANQVVHDDHMIPGDMSSGKCMCSAPPVSKDAGSGALCPGPAPPTKQSDDNQEPQTESGKDFGSPPPPTGSEDKHVPEPSLHPTAPSGSPDAHNGSAAPEPSPSSNTTEPEPESTGDGVGLFVRSGQMLTIVSGTAFILFT